MSSRLLACLSPFEFGTYYAMLPTLFSLVVLPGIYVVVQTNQDTVAINAEDLMDCCGELYDPTSESCCGCTVHYAPIGKGKRSCCGTSLLHVGRETCCEGLAQFGDACCGAIAYNASVQDCCNGAIVTRPPVLIGRSNSYLCCGQVTYNPRESLCCGEKQGGKRRKFYTVRYSKHRRLRSSAHQTKKTTPSLYRRNGDTRCCGSVAYDHQTQICCAPGVVNNRFRQGCCKNTVYLLANQTCCELRNGNADQTNLTNVVQKEGIPASKNKIILAVFNGTACCGNTGGGYNPYTQLCCDGSVRQRRGYGDCCGDKDYDRNTQICCVAKTIPLNSNVTNSSFCLNPDVEFKNLVKSTDSKQCVPASSNEIDVSEKSALYGIFPKWDHKCCATKGGDIGYNVDTQICCEGVVVDGDSCCKSKSGVIQGFLRRTHICCLGIVRPAKGYAQCCGEVAYNANIESCCDAENVILVATGLKSHNETVVDSEIDNVTDTKNQTNDESAFPIQQSKFHALISDQNDAGNKNLLNININKLRSINNGLRIYHKGTHGCCGGIVHPLRNTTCCRGAVTFGNACCGSTGYDKATEVCCSPDVVATAFATRECCGDVGFNPEMDICCNDRLYPAATHRCCNGEVGYHLYEQACCKKSLRNTYEVVDGDGCCSGEGYFKANQICCQGDTVKPLPFGGLLSASNPRELAISETNTAGAMYQCCGVEVYDLNRQFCCSGSVYNHSTHGCCQSTTGQQPLFPGSDPGRAYWLTNETCCSGHVYAGNKCCGPAGGYHSGDAICCANSVIHQLTSVADLEASVECCDTAAYNVEDSLCCGGQVVSRATHDCCMDRQSYTIGKEVCCGLRVQPGDACCAGEIGYWKGLKICCDDVVNPRILSSEDGMDVSDCCAAVAFDVTSHKCCEHTVVKPIDRDCIQGVSEAEVPVSTTQPEVELKGDAK